MIEIFLGIFVGTLVIIGTICLYLFLFPKALSGEGSEGTNNLGKYQSEGVNRALSGSIFLVSKVSLIISLVFIYLGRDTYNIRLFSYAFIPTSIVYWLALSLLIFAKTNTKVVSNSSNTN